MSDVYTQILGTPKITRNKRIYQGVYTGTTLGTTKVVTTTPPTPGVPTTAVAARVIIPFVDDQAPSILNYNTIYALSYGQYPILSIYTADDDGNYLQRSELAKLVLVDGLIDSIVYDLAEIATGFIILS